MGDARVNDGRHARKRYTLRNVNVDDNSSRETICFVADVYVDGQYRGKVRNSGRGEPNFVVPYSLERELFAVAVTSGMYESHDLTTELLLEHLGNAAST